MNTRFKTVITDFVADELVPERSALDDLSDVVALNATSPQELIGAIEHAHALMVYHSILLTKELVQRLNGCRVIVRCGVGVDNVDIAAARLRGIPVVNVPDYGTEEVADTAIGMALSLARGITQLNSLLRDSRGPWHHAPAGRRQRLRGEVFGIVGLGRIGMGTAIRAKALGMDVVFYDPYKEDGYEKSLGIRRVDSLEALLRESYIVSLHCPLTPETRHLINRDSLALMRKDAFLVNTARGAVLDTSAVARSVESGHLAGVGIDVLEQEPPQEDDVLVCAWRDRNHPAHDRVLINPHAAFYCEQGLLDIRNKAADSCRQAFLGKPIRNIVN
ncbi:MAG: C-terminal binding protein [Planctomycetes bacterium]|nr:C-terminal binding protein [Planctomycetota bacterium]